MKNLTQSCQKQKTKNQHYVSQFYLKQWSSNLGKFEVFNLKSMAINGNGGTPKRYCAEKFYFGLKTGKDDEMSQEVEEILQAQEDSISNKLEQAINNIKEGKLSEDDKKLISSLMSLYYLTNPIFRKHCIESHVDTLKDYLSIATGKDFSDQNFESTNFIHNKILLESMESFTSLFYSFSWKITVNWTNTDFVTSDAPVVEIFQDDTGCLYGIPITQRNYIFSLTPKVGIQLQYQSGKNDDIKFIDDREVITKFNRCLLANQPRYIFSTKKDELLQIKMYLGNARL